MELGCVNQAGKSAAGAGGNPAEINLNFRRITPQALEAIETTCLGTHDMDDHIAKIQGHPIGPPILVVPCGFEPGFLEALGDTLANGVKLDPAVTGANNEGIGKITKAPDVENHNVFGLFFVGQTSGQRRFLKGIEGRNGNDSFLIDQTSWVEG